MKIKILLLIGLIAAAIYYFLYWFPRLVIKEIQDGWEITVVYKGKREKLTILRADNFDKYELESGNYIELLLQSMGANTTAKLTFKLIDSAGKDLGLSKTIGGEPLS